MIASRRALKGLLFITTALGGIGAAQAQTGSDSSNDIETVIVTSARTVNASVEIAGVQAQKIVPGASPLKAIDTLPGVVYATADPWGNNEQNESLVIHGFTTQQLGFTLDGVPLGDQQYGNYNGLSPSRAISSENVGNVVLSTGAGSLGVASTSNLGGAIETFSSAPSAVQSADLRVTGGSYDAVRVFLRADTGDMGDGNSAYVSVLHQDARAWDFDGHQRGNQVNAKFVHEDDHGKLTLYADWQYKVEPNEDSDGVGNQQSCAAGAPASCASYVPYTRPFLFPNLGAALAYVNPVTGAPPLAVGSNFQNYHSAAQRQDGLAYAQYDWKLMEGITWSNQVYFHNDTARGIVAGPVNQAGLPGLFAIYFPGQNLANLFGGTGYEARTTEYKINRGGVRSTLNWDLGDHQVEAGIWYEHNYSSQHREWYPFTAANHDLTPYDVPRNPLFTQYAFGFNTDDVQLHVQDQWHVLPDLTIQAGVKASLQTAGDVVEVQQLNLPSTSPQVNYPTGSLTSNNWFLPQVGAIYDLNDTDQLFVNVQKNMRQYIPYGAGSNFYGTSPWSLGSQAAFDSFKATAHPETSWTYEAGIRTHRDLDLGPITSLQGQANYYHVNFSNRLFNVATYNFINPNPAVLINVGGVTTDGMDVAATLNFGDHFHLYDGISYNYSTYDSNYLTVTAGVSTAIPIAGKLVPLTPKWLEKFIASTNFGGFEAQVSGNFIGRRAVTYTNDLSVGATFMTGLEASYSFDAGMDYLHKLKVSGNITNLADIRGVETPNITSVSGGYSFYPIAPREFFMTVGVGL